MIWGERSEGFGQGGPADVTPDRVQPGGGEGMGQVATRIRSQPVNTCWMDALNLICNLSEANGPWWEPLTDRPPMLN